MDLGFQGEATRVGFVRAKCKDDRPIKIDGLETTGLAPGLGGRAQRTALPAQAQVVAWVGAAGARAKLGRAVLPVGPQCSKALSHFPFFIFQ